LNQDLFDRPSTADTGARNDRDLYETPAWMTRSLLRHHPIPVTARIFEPCVGDGAIVRVLRAAGFESIITNDIDERHEADLHFDAADFKLWSHPLLASIDWVITNPPFGHGFAILQEAERLARAGVAMLLRKTFLEPTLARGPWFSVHPPTRIIGEPRYSFRGRGSDSCAADWAIWEHAPDRTLKPIVIDYQAKARL
jgi:hypothetical protein